MTPAHVAEAFDFQSKDCAALGSPFMGRLMALCAARDWPKGTVRDRVFGWTGDLGPRAQSVPLRLAGALHALHLQGDPTLAQRALAAFAADMEVRIRVAIQWSHPAQRSSQGRSCDVSINTTNPLSHRSP